MGRAKLRMELIRSEKERRRAFQKRKKALEKSASELSVLCDVEVGMIIQDPFGESNEPSVWPPEPEVLERLIECYESRKGGYGSRTKTYHLSDLFKDQTEQMTEKNNQDNHSVYDEGIGSLSGGELECFVELLKAKIDTAERWIDTIMATQAGNVPVQESRDVYPEMWNPESSCMFQFQPQETQLVDLAVQESGDFYPEMWKSSDMVQFQPQETQPEAVMGFTVQESGNPYPEMWNLESSDMIQYQPQETQAGAVAGFTVQESGDRYPGMWNFGTPEVAWLQQQMRATQAVDTVSFPVQESMDLHPAIWNFDSSGMLPFQPQMMLPHSSWPYCYDTGFLVGNDVALL